MFAIGYLTMGGTDLLAKLNLAKKRNIFSQRVEMGSVFSTVYSKTCIVEVMRGHRCWNIIMSNVH